MFGPNGCCGPYPEEVYTPPKLSVYRKLINLLKGYISYLIPIRFFLKHRKGYFFPVTFPRIKRTYPNIPAAEIVSIQPMSANIGELIKWDNYTFTYTREEIYEKFGVKEEKEDDLSNKRHPLRARKHNRIFKTAIQTRRRNGRSPRRKLEQSSYTEGPSLPSWRCNFL